MTTNTKTSEREHKALEALYETYEQGEEGACTYTRVIAERSKLTHTEARRSIRALVRKGLAEYHRGLFDDDGMVAGSGYCCSKAGADLIEREREEAEKKVEREQAQATLPV